ncbi:uncharacterized protein LOC131433122 [Malaya genurostris]|nr:uncharacterized protein LOC131433122 [Malaya genurostris]XP_058455927.1 uncharacterized protein LOC131433122 [Malaya genurostris]
MSLLSLWRRYRVVIIFPALTISSIAADYTHTRKWKLSQQQQQHQ